VDTNASFKPFNLRLPVLFLTVHEAAHTLLVFERPAYLLGRYA
jgi:hypothetical protein